MAIVQVSLGESVENILLKLSDRLNIAKTSWAGNMIKLHKAQDLLKTRFSIIIGKLRLEQIVHCYILIDSNIKYLE